MLLLVFHYFSIIFKITKRMINIKPSENYTFKLTDINFSQNIMKYLVIFVYTYVLEIKSLYIVLLLILVDI